MAKMEAMQQQLLVGMQQLTAALASGGGGGAGDGGKSLGGAPPGDERDGTRGASGGPRALASRALPPLSIGGLGDADGGGGAAATAITPGAATNRPSFRSAAMATMAIRRMSGGSGRDGGAVGRQESLAMLDSTTQMFTLLREVRTRTRARARRA